MGESTTTLGSFPWFLKRNIVSFTVRLTETGHKCFSFVNIHISGFYYSYVVSSVFKDGNISVNLCM